MINLNNSYNLKYAQIRENIIRDKNVHRDISNDIEDARVIESWSVNHKPNFGRPDYFILVEEADRIMENLIRLEIFDNFLENKSKSFAFGKALRN